MPLVKDIRACDCCPVQRLFPDTVFVPPLIVKESTRLACAECPGQTEVEQGIPLVGASGSWLRGRELEPGRRNGGLYRAAGVDQSTVSLCNVINCGIAAAHKNIYPTDGNYLSKEDALAAQEHCLQAHVLPLIAERDWKRIDVFGTKSLEALTDAKGGISRWRGSPLCLKGETKPRVIPTLHPAFLARSQDLMPACVNDLRKGLAVPPERYNVHPSLEDVRNFSAPVFALDIESDRSTNRVTMVGLSSALYTAICVPFEGVYIEELKRIVTNATRIIGHNILAFDFPHLEAAGVSFPKDCEIFDTILAQHLLQPDLAHGLDFLGSFFTNKPAWKHLSGDDEALYCITPDHKVLNVDLRWVEAGTLKAGDKILGFDENGPNRQYRTSTVTHVEFATEPVYEVLLSSGKLFKTTREHKWLVCNRSLTGASAYHWSETQHLRPLSSYGTGQESKVPQLLDVWTDDLSDSWLAGMFDGEGTVRSSGKAIQIAQNPGILYEKLKVKISELTAFGEAKAGRTRDTRYIRINGTLRERLKLLGRLHPDRLVNRLKFDDFGRLECRSALDSVVSVTPAGEARIVKITTDSRTLVVDGYPMHNCCRDVDVTFQCAQQLEPLLKYERLWDLYTNVSVPLAKICHLMTETGFRIDPSRLKKVRAELEVESKKLELELPEELRTRQVPVRKRQLAPPGTLSPKTGKPLKYVMADSTEEETPWKSTQVLQEFFYVQKGLPAQTHVKTGQPTIDKTALPKLLKHADDESRRAIKALLRLRVIASLVSTFVKDEWNGIERIHSRFNPFGTASGRLSSNEPNLQNIPISARYIYVPSYTDWVIISSDFSSLENRLTALFSNDTERLERLSQPGYSEHKHNASVLFDIPYQDVVKDSAGDSPYTKAKKVTHGLNYGEGPMKIAKMNDLPFAEVKTLVEKWKAANKKTIEWQNETAARAKKDGFLVTPFHRKRWFWGSNVHTESLSFLPQSSGADIMIRCMIALMWKRIGWPEERVQKLVQVYHPLPHPARLLVTVHDSIVVETSLDTAEEVKDILKEVLEQPWPEFGGYRFPIETGVGSSWGECH